MKTTFFISVLLFVNFYSFSKDYKIITFSSYLEEYIKDVRIYAENGDLIGNTNSSGEYRLNSNYKKGIVLLLKHSNFKDTLITFNRENINIDLIMNDDYNKVITQEDYFMFHFENHELVESSLSTIKVDKQAEFIGGQQEFNKFLQENIRYPQMAIENEIEGKVYLKFVIYEDGSISKVIIMKGISRGLNKEAIRVLKLTNNMWNPATINGEKVKSYYTLPINFIIH